MDQTGGIQIPIAVIISGFAGTLTVIGVMFRMFQQAQRELLQASNTQSLQSEAKMDKLQQVYETHRGASEARIQKMQAAFDSERAIMHAESRADQAAFQKVISEQDRGQRELAVAVEGIIASVEALKNSIDASRAQRESTHNL